jgi:hypothetical protein
MTKVITAVALAGDKLVLLDNIDESTPLGCASLDAALTGTSWKNRILGISEMTPDLPLFTTWYASGNNVGLRGDVHRRLVPCRLDTAEEHPEERTGFKYPDLIGHVRQNRASLVVDALTILRGYFAAGCPVRGLTPFGSYEGWSAVVRSAVYWAIALDPIATRAGIKEADEKLLTLAAVIEGWSKLPEGTGTGHTIAEAHRLMQTEPDTYQTLRDAVMPWSKNDKLPTERVIAYKLRGLRGRVVNGLALVGMVNRTGVTLWRVEKARAVF